MDFKQLRSFVAVIRYGSFTTAAEKLRISQPTVSTHIRTLEEELGTPLVLRNAKRVELTPSGYKMFDQAESMLAMHDRMIQSMRRRESDAIYLGASSIPSGYILPEILATFSEQHRDSRFIISQDPSQTVIDGMLSGLYDLGFVGMPVKEDTLESTQFFSDRIVVVTANQEKYQAVDRSDAHSIAELLVSEHVIMRKNGSATRAAGARVLDALGLEESDLNIVAHLNDQEATKNLVQAGLGIALMSELAVRRRVEGGWMLAFDVPHVDTSRNFYLLKRKNVLLNERAEALCDFVLSHPLG
ncbi:MAG: LysR family transcriptional regulator [Eggerthellaceae bacterium]|nr:LysR family transcriptional regulator [Eggerthellaceae bacterium]